MWTKLFHFYEFAKEFFLFHMRYFDFLHFSTFSIVHGIDLFWIGIIYFEVCNFSS